MTTHPVWFITGCSTGFGRELAKLVVARGWNLVATARSKESLADLAGPNVLALSLDVTKQDQIEAAVSAARDRFGRIDVLVNNAGYGYLTTVEEGDEAEIRAMFDANVFGLFAITREILPIMRAQKSGHIMSITSMGGHIGNPASSYYVATKHAVEGWSKGLAQEVGPLGIRVTAVAPGSFRTDWAGRSMTLTRSRIADYDATVGARMKTVTGNSGKQAGDPVRAGELMIELSQMEKPPLHIVLGKQAIDLVSTRLKSVRDEIEAYRAMGEATDFPS